MPVFTVAELAEKINAKLQGSPDVAISGLASLQEAQSGHISFLDNPKYRKFLSQTQAGAVIISEQDLDACPTVALVVAKPYVAYAKVASLFAYQPIFKPGIHPTASIGQNCQIDKNAMIAAHTVIEDGVKIGAHTVISSGCVIGAGAIVGANCYLWPNVTLYHGVILHNHIIIHSGAVLGADGFGMANDQGKWLKIPQLGTVIVHDEVEIGANTTIDRGALDNTIIGKGVKLDNQIQIGHNVQIGDYTAVAACTGISGSTKLGKHCMISGMVGFAGHLEVVDNVVITGMTMVSKGINQPGIYSSGTAAEPHQSWLRNAVRFRQLDGMAQRLSNIEKRIAEMAGEKGE